MRRAVGSSSGHDPNAAAALRPAPVPHRRRPGDHADLPPRHRPAGLRGVHAARRRQRAEPRCASTSSATSRSRATQGTGFVLDTATWRANPDWGAELGYDAAALDAHQPRRRRVRAGAARRGGESPGADRDQRRDRAARRRLRGRRADVGARTRRPTTPAQIGGVRGRRRRHGLRGHDDLRRRGDRDRARRRGGRAPGRDLVHGRDRRAAARAARRSARRSSGRRRDRRRARLLHGQLRASDALRRRARRATARGCERIAGLRANASAKSHAELDEAEELDEGDPAGLGGRARRAARPAAQRAPCSAAAAAPTSATSPRSARPGRRLAARLRREPALEQPPRDRQARRQQERGRVGSAGAAPQPSTSAAAAAATSARLNQRTSWTSSSCGRGSPPSPGRLEAEHQRRRERPRLGGDVARRPDPHAALLARPRARPPPPGSPPARRSRRAPSSGAAASPARGRAARDPPSVTSMITTGSVRGWCWVRAARAGADEPGLRRRSDAAPQAAQKRWRRCQLSSAATYAASPPSCCGSTATASRSPTGRGPSAGAGGAAPLPRGAPAAIRPGTPPSPRAAGSTSTANSGPSASRPSSSGSPAAAGTASATSASRSPSITMPVVAREHGARRGVRALGGDPAGVAAAAVARAVQARAGERVRRRHAAKAGRTSAASSSSAVDVAVQLVLEHHALDAGGLVLAQPRDDLGPASRRASRGAARRPRPACSLPLGEPFGALAQLGLVGADQERVHEREAQRGRIAPGRLARRVQAPASGRGLVRSDVDDVVLVREARGERGAARLGRTAHQQRQRPLHGLGQRVELVDRPVLAREAERPVGERAADDLQLLGQPVHARRASAGTGSRRRGARAPSSPCRCRAPPARPRCGRRSRRTWRARDGWRNVAGETSVPSRSVDVTAASPQSVPQASSDPRLLAAVDRRVVVRAEQGLEAEPLARLGDARPSPPRSRPPGPRSSPRSASRGTLARGVASADRSAPAG